MGRKMLSFKKHHILKYYIAYTLALKQQTERIEARKRSGIN